MITDTKKLWDSVLVELELSISHSNFATWFRETEILREEQGIIFIGIPNEFFRSWLSEKYHKNIVKALREHFPGVRSVEYVISKPKENNHASDTPTQTIRYNENELPLGNHYINKSDNLNPRYLFTNFVIGSFNQLAHAAAQAIVKKPGIMYNPLFVYGGSGHGKTHLIQALGNALKASGPSRKLYYVTSEKFLMDFVNAMQNNKMSSFKDRYRKYDVLIMDDIQFISNKDKTQEELFHLFNHLYENNKQIIFSSDKHPGRLPDVEARLKSRFSQGMTVEITRPDHEARIAILKTKAEAIGYTLTKELLHFLATTIESNVRELEGSINAIAMQSQILGREITISEASRLLKDSSKADKAPSVRDVISTICSYYDLEESTIYEKSRRKEVVRPRQIIMYIMREDLKISYPTIGQRLGGRDHTTVIHSCDKVKSEIKSNPHFSYELDQIRAMLK